MSNNDAHRHCHPRRLAATRIGSVEVCDACQTLQLHLGSVSLRLSPDALAELLYTLEIAQLEYQGWNPTSMLADLGLDLQARRSDA